MNEDAVFYYRDEHRQQGAFTEEEFIQMIQNHEILPDHEIRIFGMNHWIPLRESLYAFYLPSQPKTDNESVDQD